MSQSQEKLRNWEKKVSPGRNVQNKSDSDEECTKWLDEYFAASHSDDDFKRKFGLLSPKKTNEDNKKNHEQSCSPTNRLAGSAADSNSSSQKPTPNASSTQIYASQVCSQKKSPKNPKPSIRVDPEVIHISSDDE